MLASGGAVLVDVVLVLVGFQLLGSTMLPSKNQVSLSFVFCFLVFLVAVVKIF